MTAASGTDQVVSNEDDGRRSAVVGAGDTGVSRGTVLRARLADAGVPLVIDQSVHCGSQRLVFQNVGAATEPLKLGAQDPERRASRSWATAPHGVKRRTLDGPM